MAGGRRVKGEGEGGGEEGGGAAKYRWLAKCLQISLASHLCGQISFGRCSMCCALCM